MNLELVKELFAKGGPAMWPLLALSILSLATIIERLWFWANIALKERAIVNRVLEAARYDWGVANEIARQAHRQPIGRFLYAPLRLLQPDPEVFRLALEAAADDELASMRRGDKVLEAVIALAPLLGLLGTVLGLINSLGSIRLGDLGTSSTAGVTLGIGEALISTAAGLVVAITSLAFYRVFQAFLFQQVKIFRKAGSELELLYRQFWPQSHNHRYAVDSSVVARPPDVLAEENSTRNKGAVKYSAPPEEPTPLEEASRLNKAIEQTTPPEEPTALEDSKASESKDLGSV